MLQEGLVRYRHASIILRSQMVWDWDTKEYYVLSGYNGTMTWLAKRITPR